MKPIHRTVYLEGWTTNRSTDSREPRRFVDIERIQPKLRVTREQIRQALPLKATPLFLLPLIPMAVIMLSIIRLITTVIQDMDTSVFPMLNTAAAMAPTIGNLIGFSAIIWMACIIFTTKAGKEPQRRIQSRIVQKMLKRPHIILKKEGQNLLICRAGASQNRVISPWEIIKVHEESYRTLEKASNQIKQEQKGKTASQIQREGRIFRPSHQSTPIQIQEPEETSTQESKVPS